MMAVTFIDDSHIYWMFPICQVLDFIPFHHFVLTITLPDKFSCSLWIILGFTPSFHLSLCSRATFSEKLSWNVWETQPPAPPTHSQHPWLPVPFPLAFSLPSPAFVHCMPPSPTKMSALWKWEQHRTHSGAPAPRTTRGAQQALAHIHQMNGSHLSANRFTAGQTSASWLENGRARIQTQSIWPKSDACRYDSLKLWLSKKIIIPDHGAGEFHCLCPSQMSG